MTSFLDVALSPVATSKFIHTVGSGYITSALFVLGISSYFILKNKHLVMAKKSFVIAASFGMLSSLFVLFNGDESAYQVANKQPVKLAAMEGLYNGEKNVGIVAFGILNPDKKIGDNNDEFLFEINTPYALEIMATMGLNNFTPGLEDLVFGNEKEDIESVSSKIQKGKIAINALSEFKKAKDINDTAAMDSSAKILQENMSNFGYGYLEKPEDIVPPVALTFIVFTLW
ncbi:cytochrome D ubiquinol oxidase%2C subunit I [Campylobacter hyointestinalis subsp. hyointestinalis]|nr:cytochrome D ubiquinol oxidase%2C subunit I [Campylobacter hyointestinalis subsp. hyointestinalis]CUU72161.1 cytochrome D ubiquinol oxidase%2C subunit I [Campylobacter hyointestinalis subsp. hyointestinalis]CUU79556.1 cytochrome D ubiquinol oxidase%2C subunit I [Campylobacter hyointestinalis subsp. hyointestinalis]